MTCHDPSSVVIVVPLVVSCLAWLYAMDNIGISILFCFACYIMLCHYYCRYALLRCVMFCDAVPDHALSCRKSCIFYPSHFSSFVSFDLIQKLFIRLPHIFHTNSKAINCNNLEGGGMRGGGGGDKRQRQQQRVWWLAHSLATVW